VDGLALAEREVPADDRLHGMRRSAGVVRAADDVPGDQVETGELVRRRRAAEHLQYGIRAACCDHRLTKLCGDDRGTRLAPLGQQYAAAEKTHGGHDIREVCPRLGDRHLLVGHRRSVPTLSNVHKIPLYSSYVTSLYKTETRHHPQGKTCHHFRYHWLTCDEYDALRARAGGRCEICGIAEEQTKRGSLVIDHYETQGLHVVRGLLCDFCNTVVMRSFMRGRTWGRAAEPWNAEARAYVANSWHQVTPEDLARPAAFMQERVRRGRPRKGAAG
jgi:Recombination endonuclease VII